MCSLCAILRRSMLLIVYIILHLQSVACNENEAVRFISKKSNDTIINGKQEGREKLSLPSSALQVMLLSVRVIYQGFVSPGATGVTPAAVNSPATGVSVVAEHSAGPHAGAPQHVLT